MKTDERYGEQKLKDLKLLLTCRMLTFTQKTQQCFPLKALNEEPKAD